MTEQFHEGDVIPEWGDRPLSASEAADLNERAGTPAGQAYIASLHKITSPAETARVKRARAYQEAQKALDGLPYRREADEIIHLVFEARYNGPLRTRSVAEYLAAHFQYRTPEGPQAPV